MFCILYPTCSICCWVCTFIKNSFRALCVYHGYLLRLNTLDALQSLVNVVFTAVDIRRNLLLAEAEVTTLLVRGGDFLPFLQLLSGENIPSPPLTNDIVTFSRVSNLNKKPWF